MRSPVPPEAESVDVTHEFLSNFFGTALPSCAAEDVSAVSRRVESIAWTWTPFRWEATAHLPRSLMNRAAAEYQQHGPLKASEVFLEGLRIPAVNTVQDCDPLQECERRIWAARCLLDAGLPVSAWSQIQAAVCCSSDPSVIREFSACSVVELWLTMGAAAAALQDMDTAASWCTRAAIQLKKQLTADHSVSVRTRALCGDALCLQGFLRASCGDLAGALRSTMDAFAIHLDAGEPESAAIDLHLQAQYELLQGRPDDAAETADFALELLEPCRGKRAFPRAGQLDDACRKLRQTVAMRSSWQHNGSINDQNHGKASVN
jgi:hypothetical protein